MKTKVTPALLQDALDKFERTYRFSKGDLIKAKVGLQHKKFPAVGDPAIVIEHLDEPLARTGEHGPGSPYFCERLDLYVLAIDPNDGEPMEVMLDSRRFEPY